MDQIDPTAPPSGTGCAECGATGGWWLHLRRCAGDWFWDYADSEYAEGPEPADWRRQLH